VDLLDVLILALRLALVAVLYGFLVLVMRGAARGLRPAPPLANPRPTSAPNLAKLRLIVLEPGSSALRSGQVIELPDAAVLGRGARAAVVIADPAVSAEHARVSRVGRAWVITDLGSSRHTLTRRLRDTEFSVALSERAGQDSDARYV
jgi:hypothetical protein